MSRPAGGSRGEGFALVEALASLVIVGMIGLMVAEGVGAGHRVWERIDAQEASAEGVDGAQTTLRARIEEIYPSTLYNKNPPYIDFQGYSDRMAFLSNPPYSERPAPIRRYTLGLNAKAQLWLASVSDVADPRTPPSVHVLLGGVRRVELSYFGRPDNGEAREWHGQWNAQTALPEVIRLRIEFEPRDRRRWPDLLIHPRTTIDTSCLLNPTTHRCKGRV